MSKLHFSFIGTDRANEMYEYIRILNDFTSESQLRSRILGMFDCENYSCLGVFQGEELIGICGMWLQMRHYSGRSLEVDHVVISSEYRSQGIGEKLFTYIEKWCLENNIEAIELNAYVKNEASHRFYDRLNFERPGFHFKKHL